MSEEFKLKVLQNKVDAFRSWLFEEYPAPFMGLKIPKSHTEIQIKQKFAEVFGEQSFANRLSSKPEGT